MIKKIVSFVFDNYKDLFQIYKIITKDNKITFTDLVEVAEYYKKSGLDYDPLDKEYIFTAGEVLDIDALPVNKNTDPVIYEQSSRTCVIYWLTRSLMYNSDLVFTKKDIESIKELAEKLGLWKDKKGMTFLNWVKAIEKRLEKYKGYKLYYFKEAIGSPDFEKLINKNYMAGIGWYITAKYLAQIKQNGKIDISAYDFKENKKYGHLWTFYNHKKNTQAGVIKNNIDNYPNRLGINNKYVNNHIKDFVNKGYFFSYWYFLFVEKTLEHEKENIKKAITDYKIEYASQNIQNLYNIYKSYLDKGYKPVFKNFWGVDDEETTARLLIEIALFRK